MIEYYAKLDGELFGMEKHIRFKAENLRKAKLFADNKAEENLKNHMENYDPEDFPLFHAEVEIYDAQKHDEFFTQEQENK